MNTWKSCGVLAGLLAAVLASLPGVASPDAPKKGGAGALIVIDNAGKEHKLKTWKFLDGTERLSWLAAKAPAAKAGKKEEPAKTAAGPEALKIREENSTTFRNGIVTFVPLDRISKIDYDAENKTVTIAVAKPGDKTEEVIMGSTRFVGVNKLTIEAEVDLGELGTAAVKFYGGTRNGIRGVRFPAPKPGAALNGRAAEVTAADQDKTVHKVVDPQPLYRLTGVEYRLIPTLRFQKTVKLDLAKIQGLRRPESEDNPAGAKDYEVTLKDGKQVTLTLLDQVSPLDGKPALLEGFAARVPAGYKLFPMHTIAAIQFEGKPAETKPGR
jgi:hypothetical protein